jgi:soluble lytic murein transglycosylase-like protein
VTSPRKWLRLKFDAWLGAAAGRFALAAASKWDNQLRVLVEMTERLRGELRVRTDALHSAEARVKDLETRQRQVQAYFADLPPTRGEIDWTRDDAAQLADFLETKPAGKKLAVHLMNRLADYERHAALFSTGDQIALGHKRAHGFRDCRGEILRLSAAGPSPANHEPQDLALPADLENLRA